MAPRLYRAAPGPPCPLCGREWAAHPHRWALDDYVAGVTGRGPRIAAADVGRVRCSEPSENPTRGQSDRRDSPK